MHRGRLQKQNSRVYEIIDPEVINLKKKGVFFWEAGGIVKRPVKNCEAAGFRPLIYRGKKPCTLFTSLANLI